MPLRVVLRVLLALGVATFLGRALSGAATLLGTNIIARAFSTASLALAVVGAYGAILLVTRELGREDLALVKRVLKRSA